MLFRSVKYNFGQAGYKIDTKITDTKTTVITGVWVRDAAGKETLVTGDYYLFSVPVEVMAPLLTPEIIKADESLNTITELANDVQWMNGLQFYLNEDVQINPGHVIYADSQWALTSISQIQYWNGYDLSDRYNGKVKGILSVDISDWFDKGFNGKLADECSPDDIQQEVWHQLKNSLNINGQEILKDSMKEFWHLDHDIQPNGKINKDREPLLVNKVNTWTLRPTAYTNLPNMFLASDYCQTFTDLATMEGANESARRAVNCIINAADSDADYCKVWNLHEPMILAPFRDLYQKRWEKGLPWKNML